MHASVNFTSPVPLKNLWLVRTAYFIQLTSLKRVPEITEHVASIIDRRSFHQTSIPDNSLLRHKTKQRGSSAPGITAVTAHRFSENQQKPSTKETAGLNGKHPHSSDSKSHTYLTPDCTSFKLCQHRTQDRTSGILGKQLSALEKAASIFSQILFPVCQRDLPDCRSQPPNCQTEIPICQNHL